MPLSGPHLRMFFFLAIQGAVPTLIFDIRYAPERPVEPP